jgi:hypothetical protein
MKRRRLSIGSFAIIDVITNFTHVVKLEMKRMEMTKFIAS